MKTLVMIAGLAAVFAAGSACFGLLSRRPDPHPGAAACDGLDGDARRACEARQPRER